MLFVEVPRALHSLISDPEATRRAWKRMGRVRHVPHGPLLYTPLPVLPIYYNPLTNWVNQRLLLIQLRRVLVRLDWRLDVLWTYWPNTAYLIGRLAERASVYHCIDDFVAVGYPLTTRGMIARMEAEQCRKVHVVFARTEGLAEAKRLFNANTHLLQGGVDTSQFDPAHVPEPPPGLASLPHPRIGFIGTIDDRVNMELLSRCATTLQYATFILIGPVRRHRANTRPLENLSNVHFLPAVPHSDVPAIMAALDVCLIPYRISPYTRGLSPIKLYEYLAMAKPVVATDLPYLRREAAHIRIAGTAEGFLAALRAALAQPPTEQQQTQWRATAEAHSWESQILEIERHLDAHLGPNP